MQEQVQSPVLENPVSRLDRVGFQIRTGGVQRLPNDSETNKGSDVLTMPKKSAPGKEGEGGPADEKGGRDSVGSEYASDRAISDDDDEPLFSRLHKGKSHPVATVRKERSGSTHVYTLKSKVRSTFVVLSLHYITVRDKGEQAPSYR